MITTILNVLGAVASAFGVLKGAGVNLGPLGNEALTALESAAVNIANFENGNAVPIGHFTEGGVRGTIVVVKDGGSAATALGL